MRVNEGFFRWQGGGGGGGLGSYPSIGFPSNPERPLLEGGEPFEETDQEFEGVLRRALVPHLAVFRAVAVRPPHKGWALQEYDRGHLSIKTCWELGCGVWLLRNTLTPNHKSQML